MQALSEIAQRIDLDFCGVDFSLLPDGRILLFEANATMLVHLEEFHPELQFKNRHVQGILDAFNHMLVERLAR
jgi:glutathione synthase/RimK-type ligase-like ATP-grasp enzyme